ncbi:glycopeptide antibiotics resistance protein [Labedaea rhizosphaerae]|uniref:Glycopeptide antibiotics resistance protein n=2 Tax=Labedaea rhizosphaerae TaxID=598644 RepID=A0A4R6SCG6_LABRH|nr:glycopeptide antibiotics resistance protein [Labedaea rhizosphaerae]
MPALVAFIGGAIVALLFAVPYLAWTYRRRGEFGWGHALLAFVFVVYLFAIWTYALLPAPDTTAQWCAQHATGDPQWKPFQFIDDIRTQRERGITALLHNRALPQVVFNVALFVPFGMFGRHLLRRGPVTVVLGGFLMSLFVEFTQLTGVFGLFRCPYRIFDVDDLITNTLGTLVGVLIAPLLRLFPGQQTSAPAGVARPITGRRRILGMAIDVALVLLLGAALQVLANRTGNELKPLLAIATPAVVVLLLVPLLGNGATVGQWVVLLRPVDPLGRKPSVARVIVRCVTGSGGFFALVCWALLHESNTPLAAAGAMLVVSGLVALWPKDHRGLSGLLSGLGLVDTRVTEAGTSLAAKDHPVAEERR